MSQDISLREAVLNDLPQIRLLFEETINAVCENDYSAKQLKVWSASFERNPLKWEKRLSDQYFIVAEIDGTIVGIASLENDNYIDVMYVHKDFQGKGIASVLLDHLLTRAGNTEISSDVSKTARTFFERKGFEVVKENHLEIDGVPISNFRMRKKTNL